MTTELNNMVTENLVEGVENTFEAVEEVAKVAKNGNIIGKLAFAFTTGALIATAVCKVIEGKKDDEPKKEKKAKKNWFKKKETPEEEVTVDVEVENETEQK